MKVKPPRPATPPPPASKKRAAPDDDDVPAAKRARTADRLPADLVFSPSKKKRLEEDGLIMLDTADEKVEDDDIIEID